MKIIFWLTHKLYIDSKTVLEATNSKKKIVLYVTKNIALSNSCPKVADFLYEHTQKPRDPLLKRSFVKSDSK